MDLIERQAAIDAIHCDITVTGRQNAELVAKTIGTFADRIKALPSAQPEPCEDAVSRRILLNDLKELITAWEKYPVMAEQIKGVETAIGYVKTIPSVTPKRKTGKWIKDDFTGIIQCDQCGNDSPMDTTGGGQYESNFCPNCGADMRSEAEQEVK